MVPMGGPVDDFTDRALPDYFTNAVDGSPEAVFHGNRQLLKNILGTTGFVQHPGEWWHFSLGDQLWAWRNGAAAARYGRINNPVDGVSTAPDPTAEVGEDCPSHLADVLPTHRY